MAVLTHAQLVTLWEVEGGNPLAADTAAAVAQAESGGETTKINNTAYPRRPGYHKPAPGALPEYSVGLWQINMVAHPGYTQTQLLTAVGNADAAIAISGDGANWGPWTTFTNGDYAQFLQRPGVPIPQAVRDSTQPIRSMQGWTAATQALAADIPSALNKAGRLHRAALRALP